MDPLDIHGCGCDQHPWISIQWLHWSRDSATSSSRSKSEDFRALQSPGSFNDLEGGEQSTALEMYRELQIWYLYVRYTGLQNKIHFEAMNNPCFVMANKSSDTLSRPWEGDNTPLGACIVELLTCWLITRPSHTRRISCINHTKEEITWYLAIDDKQ
jgi:hypothetical protein